MALVDFARSSRRSNAKAQACSLDLLGGSPLPRSYVVVAASAKCPRSVRSSSCDGERGTKHEAVVAEMKLASLRGRYDFSASPGAATTDPDDDLFSNAARIRPDQKNRRRLIVFDMEDAPIGNFVKWVLLNGFQIDGVWLQPQVAKQLRCTLARIKRTFPLSGTLPRW